MRLGARVRMMQILYSILVLDNPLKERYLFRKVLSPFRHLPSDLLLELARGIVASHDEAGVVFDSLYRLEFRLQTRDFSEVSSVQRLPPVAFPQVLGQIRGVARLEDTRSLVLMLLRPDQHAGCAGAGVGGDGRSKDRLRTTCSGLDPNWSVWVQYGSVLVLVLRRLLVLE